MDEGESLCSLNMANRASLAEGIRLVKEISDDDSWKLRHGDVIYIKYMRWPFRVFRLGYGDYERDVRVARLHEDTSRRTVGQWVQTDRCYKLEENDTLLAMEAVDDASDPPTRIPEGAVCEFLGWDSDGDAELLFEQRRVVVFMKDLDAFSLR